MAFSNIWAILFLSLLLLSIASFSSLFFFTYLSPSFLWFTQAQSGAAGRGGRSEDGEGEEGRRSMKRGKKWRKEPGESVFGGLIREKDQMERRERGKRTERGGGGGRSVQASLRARKPFKVKLAWRISGQTECVSDRLQPTLTSPQRDDSSSFTLRAPLPAGPSHLFQMSLKTPQLHSNASSKTLHRFLSMAALIVTFHISCALIMHRRALSLIWQ